MAVGGARVQDAIAGDRRLRRREGRRQRAGGEAREAGAGGGFDQGDAAGGAASDPESDCARCSTGVGAGGGQAVRGPFTARAAAAQVRGAAVSVARCGPADQARAPYARQTARVLMRETYDFEAIVNGLNQYLRLRSIPIDMKLIENVEEKEAIPKFRRRKSRHKT